LIVKKYSYPCNQPLRPKDGSKVVSLLYQPPFTPRKIPVGDSFDPRATVSLEGLGKLKTSNFIMNRTYNLAA
jgi:hypothetical protein